MASNTWTLQSDPWVVFWGQEKKLNPEVSFTEAYSKWVDYFKTIGNYPYFDSPKDPYNAPDIFV